ncbi:MAG: ferrous iron transport protein A [Armatimonadetes bacterium]|nr:ferrous iron transport protein A [Armatimonadota bacterium]
MDSGFNFSQLRKGMKARVSSVSGGAAGSARLLELGLTPGTEFTVTKVAPFGDPIEIRVRGSRLCLRRTETAVLSLEPVE